MNDTTTAPAERHRSAIVSVMVEETEVHNYSGGERVVLIGRSDVVAARTQRAATVTARDCEYDAAVQAKLEELAITVGNLIAVENEP